MLPIGLISKGLILVLHDLLLSSPLCAILTRNEELEVIPGILISKCDMGRFCNWRAGLRV
jgi:hypothetical protein